MKKFITVAALLAAGTALAVAEDIFTVGTPWGTTAMTQQYSFSVDLSLISKSATSSLTASTYDVSMLSVALASGSNVNGSSTNCTWSAPASANASTTGSVTGTYIVVADISNNILAISSAGTAYSGQTYTESSSSTQSGKAIVRFSFDDAFSLSKGKTLSAYFVSDVSTLTIGSSLPVSEGKATTNPAYTGILSSNGTPSVLYTMSAVVPEPSAFGLLAGAGALALVAARRRRSK